MRYGYSTTVSTKHNYDNIVRKAFLNGLSSCDYLSKSFRKTEVAQMDKEKKENNIILLTSQCAIQEQLLAIFPVY